MSAKQRVWGYLRAMGPEQLWDVPWTHLASELGVSSRTVSRAVKDLEVDGLLLITRVRQAGVTLGGRNAVTVYDPETGEATRPLPPACAQCGRDEDGEPVECGCGTQDTAA